MASTRLGRHWDVCTQSRSHKDDKIGQHGYQASSLDRVENLAQEQQLRQKFVATNAR